MRTGPKERTVHQITVGSHPITALSDGPSRLPPMFLPGLDPRSHDSGPDADGTVHIPSDRTRRHLLRHGRDIQPFHNEELLHRALSAKRGELVLATKVGFTFTDDGKLKMSNGTPVVDGRPEHLTRAIEGSLRRLGTDYIGLVYLHRIDPEVPIEDTMGALPGLVAAGKIGHMGLSEAAPRRSAARTT